MKIHKYINIIFNIIFLGLSLAPYLIIAIEAPRMGKPGLEPAKSWTREELDAEKNRLEQEKSKLEESQKEEIRKREELKSKEREYRKKWLKSRPELTDSQSKQTYEDFIKAQYKTDLAQRKISTMESFKKNIDQQLAKIKKLEQQLEKGYEEKKPQEETSIQRFKKFITEIKDFIKNLFSKTKETVNIKTEDVASFMKTNSELVKEEIGTKLENLPLQDREPLREKLFPKLTDKLDKAKSKVISMAGDTITSELNDKFSSYENQFKTEILQAQSADELNAIENTINKTLKDTSLIKEFKQKADINALYETVFGTKNPYFTLGLKENATQSAIKAKSDNLTTLEQKDALDTLTNPSLKAMADENLDLLSTMKTQLESTISSAYSDFITTLESMSKVLEERREQMQQAKKTGKGTSKGPPG